jgi:hypothetical protein
MSIHRRSLGLYRATSSQQCSEDDTVSDAIHQSKLRLARWQCPFHTAESRSQSSWNPTKYHPRPAGVRTDRDFPSLVGYWIRSTDLDQFSPNGNVENGQRGFLGSPQRVVLAGLDHEQELESQLARDVVDEMEIVDRPSQARSSGQVCDGEMGQRAD